MTRGSGLVLVVAAVFVAASAYPNSQTPNPETAAAAPESQIPKPAPATQSSFLTARGAPPPLAHASRLRARRGPQALLPTQSSALSPQSSYLGSAACERCHQTEYAQWRRELHVQMTKPLEEAKILGDFGSGARFEAHGRAYAMEMRDGRYFISVSHRGSPAETFEVHYTLGAKRFQGYISMLPDGRMYVLPAFWHVDSRRWIDWKEITPVPDTDHDLRQIWNITCFNCHATNLVKSFDAAAKRYGTKWTEMGIGCEACHGPGREHVELMGAWEARPAERPTYDNSARNRDLGKILKIFSPRTADRRAIFDTCAYCHGNKSNYFVGFKPGDRYEDYALPFLISAPIPEHDPQGEFWPDGRPNRFNRPQALMLSGCFVRGEIVCTNCHVAHGSRNEHDLKVPVRDARGAVTRQSDGLCTQCHKELGARRSALGTRGDSVLSPQSSVLTLRSVPSLLSALGASPPLAAASRLRARQRPQALLSPQSSSLNVSLMSDDLSGHTHHPADSSGSRCVECHMSDVNWRLLMRRRDHTFAAPVPEMTARYGVPNACTTCHDDRSPEWAAQVMDRWYGDGERRGKAMRVADAFYEAGAGNGDVLPALAALAVDRSLGPVARASAAEYIGRLLGGPSGPSGSSGSSGSAGAGGSQTSFETDRSSVAGRQSSVKPEPRAPSPEAQALPERRPSTSSGRPEPVEGRAPSPEPRVVNVLIGAAADPEPMVRAAAVRALGVIGERRAVVPLTARLVDTARVVRVVAAQALLRLGVVTLDGAAGVALARAQDEFAAHLSTFSDYVPNYVNLGWLEMSRGREAEAEAALARALALDPTNARPFVYRGIIAARAGRYQDAIREWRAAKALAPGDRTIDRLIEEAQRRLSSPPRP